MSDSIETLETQLADARAEVDEHGGRWQTANAAATQALRDAVKHDEAAQAAKIFGRIPTPTSRRYERLARERREARIQHSQEAVNTAPASHTAHANLRSAERRLAAAREAQEFPGLVELDREQWRDAMAVQRVHDAVEADQLSHEEAYTSDGTVRREAHDRELRALEADDGLGEDPWGPDASDNGEDDGYAEAAADARADQLEVMYLDRSIDADQRAHEEVYTPEGHIRQHLLSGQEPEQETQQRAQEPEPTREYARDVGFDIDEPF